MTKKTIYPKHTGGVVLGAYGRDARSSYDGNPQPGMGAASLTRENGPVNPEEAGKLAAKIAQERAERIRTQGHG